MYVYWLNISLCSKTDCETRISDPIKCSPWAFDKSQQITIKYLMLNCKGRLQAASYQNKNECLLVFAGLSMNHGIKCLLERQKWQKKTNILTIKGTFVNPRLSRSRRVLLSLVRNCLYIYIKTVFLHYFLDRPRELWTCGQKTRLKCHLRA